MANFETAFSITARNEGGYANNKLDAGGETYAGIARNFWPGWVGWQIIDAIKAKHGTIDIDSYLSADAGLQAEVKTFYQENFWKVNRLDAVVNQEIANRLYDISVNSGTGTAAKTLQEALNLTNVNGQLYPDTAIDGKVGPQTIYLTNSHPRPALLLKLINALQAERYIKILRANPSQEVFTNSWFSRL